MVAETNDDVPETALADLYQWLFEKDTLDHKLNENDEQELTLICHELAQKYEPRIKKMDYPDAEILKSKPGFCHGPLHSGFLLMGEHSATPIHDHGDCFSLSLVLRGTVRFAFFSEMTDSSSCKLSSQGAIELTQNQFSYLPAKSGLLHKLTAVSKHACMLDILYRVSDIETERYWYLPLTSVVKNPVYCQKMAESEFTTISRGKFPEIQLMED